MTRNRAALDDVAAAALWAEGYLLERGTEDLRANLHRLSFEAFLDAIDVNPAPIIRAIARAIDGRSVRGVLTDDECHAAFGCYPEHLPKRRMRVLAGRAGRRGGKTSRLVATLAVYQALTARLDLLAPAERAFSLIIAPRKDLAVQALSFVRSWLLHPLLRPLVIRGRASSAEEEAALSTERVMLRRPHDGRVVEIRVVAASAGGTGSRSRTCVFFALDEASFFRSDAEYAVNDTELFRASLPALVPDGRAALTSTPWIEGVGELEQRITADFGRHEKSLCFIATTRQLNPAWDPTGELEADLREDPDNHAREILAIPLPASSALFFPPDVVDAAIGEYDELPPNGGPHRAGVDLGFRRNSSSIAIARAEDARAVVAFLEGLRPRDFGGRLAPSAVVTRFAAHAVRYMATTMRGDLVGADTALEELAKPGAPRNALGHTVTYVELENTASANADRMAELRRRMLEGRVRLPRNPRLRSQFLRTTWRPGEGGAVKIILPRNASEHGDELVAVCNAVTAVPLGPRTLDDARVIRGREGASAVEATAAKDGPLAPQHRGPTGGDFLGQMLRGGTLGGGY